jgi:NitT/TauT family transport system permease protein
MLTRSESHPAEIRISRTAPTREPLAKIGLASLAVVLWLGGAGITLYWPNADDWDYTNSLVAGQLVVGAFCAVLAAFATQTGRLPALWAKHIRRGLQVIPWLIAIAVIVSAWEIVTAKLGLLPRPFFAPPQMLIGVYAEDYPRLVSSVLHSVRLLLLGYGMGSVTGFVAGVGIGWSRAVGYWLHPVLRLVGPLPATAWLPLAFFFFPSSFSASIFLIALATAFPVAVLTWSGVANVNPAYYDIARTLGGRPIFLIARVAIPAALPSVFVGLFMGMGASFSVLIVAEMMGVKAGLGWYLQWAQGWAAYSNMYAALLVMALMCSGLIALLFLVRDKLLAWQKGLMKW